MKRNAMTVKSSFSIVLFLVMFMVLVSASCALLKVKASVAGYVFMNDKLMPNFEVQLIDASNTVVAFGKTNQQGHFLISDVPPGEYTVRVLTFAGVPHPKTIQITVRPGRTETFDIDLGGEKIPEPKPGL